MVDKIVGKGVSIVVREVNTVIKKPRKGMARIALVYPSTYEASLSSLAVHMIYYLGNSYRDVYIERFVYNRGEPRSLETSSPLRDFKYIIASIHYELDYVNLVKMLLKTGIEPYRSKRRLEHVIFIGGPPVIANPSPLEDIIDCFVIGEVEPLLPLIIETIIEYSDEPAMVLEKLSSINGFYIPGYNNSTRRVWARGLDNVFYPVRQIQCIDREPVFGRGLIVETTRGCPMWCRFCMESRLFKPYRARSYSVLKKIVDKGLEYNRLDRVIIYSLYFPGSTSEKKLLEYIASSGYRASIPSIRIDLVEDDILELIHGVGQKTIVVGLENISCYGRRVLGKYSWDIDFYDRLKTIVDKGFDLKIYLILGIKGESLDSVRENIEFVRKTASYARDHGRRVTVTINPLVPKPHTPFQWIGMIDLDRAKKIISYAKRELNGLVDTRPLYVNWAWVQACIALGDSSLSKIIVEWAIEDGGLGGWRRVLKKNNYSTEYVFRGREYGRELPWSNIGIGEHVDEVCAREYTVLKDIVKTQD